MTYQTLRIPRFKGMDLRFGFHNPDPAASPDAVNVRCERGILTAAKGLRPLLVAPQGSLRLFEGFFGDESVLLAAGGGCIWALKNGSWLLLGRGFHSDDWCAVNYRKDDSDALILVNGRDKMQLWNGTDTSLREIQVRMGGEDILFSRLTLIYERLWGAVTTAAPDRIYWSGTFAPDDWELNYVVTEEGGGFIDAATFDGSRIRAVVAAFDDVLIVKDRSMHRLSGTYPGDFSLTQVYGTEGTLAARTLITTAGRLYFLGRDGLCIYDGMTVSSLLHKGDARMQALFGRINQAAVDSACAVLAGDVIRLAVPLDGAAENTHIIEYSLADDSWSLIACPGVRDLLLRREGQKETLLCLTGNGLFEYGAGESAMGTAIWKSPFLAEDLRRRRTGRVSFAVEAPESGALSLCLISENGECRERIPFGAGLTRVRRRMRVRGRSLRFELRSDSLFSLPNGLSIEIETEKDP